MGKFGRALVGGIAGGAQASGEVFDTQMKAKETDRKSEILAKRETTLAKLRDGFASERQAKQNIYTEGVTTSKQEYEKTQAGSGRYLRGKALSQEEYAGLADEDKSQALTTDEYKAQEAESEWGQKKKEIELRGKVQKDVYSGRAKGLAAPKTTDKKYAGKQAKDSIESVMSKYDLTKDLDSDKLYAINLRSSGIKDDTDAELKERIKKETKEVDDLIVYIDSKGYEVTKTDLGNGEFRISLGAFNYDKFKANQNIGIQEYEKVDDIKSKTQKANDDLFAMFEAQKAKTDKLTPAAGSNVNTEQGGSSIAAPILTDEAVKLQGAIPTAAPAYPGGTGWGGVAGDTAEVIKRNLAKYKGRPSEYRTYEDN